MSAKPVTTMYASVLFLKACVEPVALRCGSIFECSLLLSSIAVGVVVRWETP